MREQAQFELRIIGRDELVSLFRDESRPNPPALFSANRNVLQVRIAGRQPARSRDGLIQLSMDACSGGDLERQRMGIEALQLVQLAILVNQTRQIVSLS